MLPNVFEVQDAEDESDNGDSSWVQLILVLVYEFLRYEKSTWKPYLDVLPEQFDTPMFWSTEELGHLQASSVLAKIGRNTAEEMFRKQILPIIKESSGLFIPTGGVLPTDEQLMSLAHRAGSAIMAYAFNLENEDDESEDEGEEWIEDASSSLLMGMVPMADILNADAEFNVRTCRR